MMCFRDMSFCSSSHLCGNTECHRNYTDEIRAEAETWWNPTGDPDKKDGAPISISDYRSTCGMFIEKEFPHAKS